MKGRQKLHQAHLFNEYPFVTELIRQVNINAVIVTFFIRETSCIFAEVCFHRPRCVEGSNKTQRL